MEELSRVPRAPLSESVSLHLFADVRQAVGQELHSVSVCAAQGEGRAGLRRAEDTNPLRSSSLLCRKHALLIGEPAACTGA